MKSIRQRLVIELFAWLGILWILAGTATMFTVRHGLLSSFDAELLAVSSAARFLNNPRSMHMRSSSHPGPGPDHRRRLFVQGGEFFSQIWNMDTGETIQRSESLEELELPRPTHFTKEPRFWNQRLVNGTHVRLVGMRTRTRRPPHSQRGRPMYLVVAHDRAELDQTLSLLLGCFSMVGFVGAIAAALIVHTVLRRGLMPLNRLATQAETIDERSLTSRFELNDLPSELLPICYRLNDLLARLEKGFERERRFSSDLAHEFRTPVAELKTMAEVAIRWPHRASPEQYTEVLAITERMQNILENLLMLARWEQSTAKITKETVIVTEIVHTCWQPFAEEAAAKSLNVDKSIPPEFSLTTHPGMFELILRNLFSNAVEYTPTQGIIRIGCTQSVDGEAVMSVANSIQKLTPVDVPHLFERFWRHDPSRTDSHHSGLGLSLAKTCADALSLELSATINKDPLLEFRLKEIRREGHSVD